MKKTLMLLAAVLFFMAGCVTPNPEPVCDIHTFSCECPDGYEVGQKASPRVLVIPQSKQVCQVIEICPICKSKEDK